MQPEQFLAYMFVIYHDSFVANSAYVQIQILTLTSANLLWIILFIPEALLFLSQPTT